jgi:hypothetical protein
MTHRLEQTISALQKLPEPEQDAMATLILYQITDDSACDEAFARSQDQLEQLARKARADVAEGLVRRLSARRP